MNTTQATSSQIVTALAALAYLANPTLIFEVWKGGMSFHGGVIGVTLGILYLARKNGLNWLRVHDYIACCVPFGLFFGRAANRIRAFAGKALADARGLRSVIGKADVAARRRRDRADLQHRLEQLHHRRGGRRAVRARRRMDRSPHRARPSPSSCQRPASRLINHLLISKAWTPNGWRGWNRSGLPRTAPSSAMYSRAVGRTSPTTL